MAGKEEERTGQRLNTPWEAGNLTQLRKTTAKQWVIFPACNKMYPQCIHNLGVCNSYGAVTPCKTPM